MHGPLEWVMLDLVQTVFQTLTVGGLEDGFFSIHGIIVTPIDFHFFQRGRLKPTTRYIKLPADFNTSSFNNFGIAPGQRGRPRAGGCSYRAGETHGTSMVWGLRKKCETKYIMIYG